MTSRTRSLRTLLAAALVAGMAALAPAAHAQTIKIGTVVWIGYGPYYVAEALDLYKKSGMKVELQVFTDPALIPPAIESGAVAGGMVTYDQVIGVVAKGSTQRVVAPIDYSNGGDAIVATKDVTKVSQFKGKKVGFNPLSPSDFLQPHDVGALLGDGWTVEIDETRERTTPPPEGSGHTHDAVLRVHRH